MSEVQTQGQEILVDPETGDVVKKKAQPGSELVSWLVGTVGPWRDHRNRNYLERWAEYWRMWRGIWDESDKNRASERSRLIAPALSQAIEMSVAEVEEAVLSREVWFDVSDDVNDEDRLDATLMRDQLLEDLDDVNARDVIAEGVLNAAIMGTGIIKVNTDVAKDSKPVRDPVDGGLTAQETERVYVCLEAYRPDQFIPDPAGRKISEMMGCAFEHDVPKHAILEKIEMGIYRDDAASLLGGNINREHSHALNMNESILNGEAESCNVIEYHGKVPAKFLTRLQEAKTALDEIVELEAEMDDTTLVEAIVTYANDSVLLRAIPNPFALRDRAVVAFQWERVPGRFWGRGVAEKGYNPQKALDAEMRARADALGFISAPMLGIDAGRIPRGFKPEVKPGKVWLTNGPPDEVLRPVQIGALEPNTFNQTAELTQMVQMGTGAFDTATTLRGSTQSGGNAANAGSMMLGAFVKRSKRAIQNVDRNLLKPLIRKVALRYMQFAPDRYPFDDTSFKVNATMGIIAREIEQVNLTQLIGMLPDQGVQTKLAAAQGFIELSSVLNKSQIMQALEQDRQMAAQQQQAQQQAEQQKAQLENRLQEIALEGETLANQKVLAEIRKLLAQAQSEERMVDIKEIQAVLEGQKIQINAHEVELFGEQNDLQERRLDLQERQVALNERKARNGQS